MLHYKSKPEEILYHIEQMEMLLMSEKDRLNIAKILALENILKDQSLKVLIAEDLQDEDWIEDTQILVDTCYKKMERDLISQEHIDECRNFMVYRYLEEKCGTCSIEITKSITGWIFNEYDKHGGKSRWVSQKFVRAFDMSKMPRKLEPLLQEEPFLNIDLAWIQKRRDELYSQDIFLEINMRKRKSLVKS